MLFALIVVGPNATSLGVMVGQAHNCLTFADVLLRVAETSAKSAGIKVTILLTCCKLLHKLKPMLK